MKYFLWLAITFASCPTIVSQQVVEHHASVAESATPSSFERKIDSRIERFSTSGGTLVDSVIELAYKYQVPMAIEYADWEATKRPLHLAFHNKSFRGIVEAIVKEDPQYRVSFSNSIVDIFSPIAREDSSNLLNKIMKDFSVTEMETRLADSQLFCALVQAVNSGGCGGSRAVGQWDPLRITLHLHNVRVYEILNAIVAQNGRAIWTVTVSNLASLPQCCGLWYIYPLQQPFKAVVSERLEHQIAGEPWPTFRGKERQLTNDEVESLRKRNECEQRFYDNKIYEVDGSSVMAACKQNPERRP